MLLYIKVVVQFYFLDLSPLLFVFWVWEFMIKLKIKLSLEMKHHVDSVRGSVTLKIVLVFQVQHTTLRYNSVNFLKTF